MSKDQESPNKDKKNHKSNARRSIELIKNITSPSESCSAEVRVKIVSLFYKIS